MLSRRILQDRPSLQDNANPRFMHLLVFKIIEKKITHRRDLTYIYFYSDVNNCMHKTNLPSLYVKYLYFCTTKNRSRLFSNRWLCRYM